jgi:hypothetical protein
VGSLTFDANVPLEVTHLVENLDAIAQAVTHVDQSVVPDYDAMHGAQEYTANPCVRLCLCALTPPLTQVMLRCCWLLLLLTLVTVKVAIRAVFPWPLVVLVKAMVDVYVPGLRLPGLIREKVTATGVVVAVPKVMLAFSHAGIPVI